VLGVTLIIIIIIIIMYDYTSYNWSHWNSNEKLKENPEAIPGKHSIDSLQQTAVLGTSHIIRKVLQCET
jgi:hypothetical protein